MADRREALLDGSDLEAADGVYDTQPRPHRPLDIVLVRSRVAKINADSFEHMPTIAVRMPNGALTSLAGNVDPHHRVAAADLLLVQNRVRDTVERLVAEHEPDVVGQPNTRRCINSETTLT